MEVYQRILKIFLNKEMWSKYQEALDLDFIKNNLPQLYKLFRVVEILHNEIANDLTVLDLEAGLMIHYPGVPVEDFLSLFNVLREDVPDPEQVLKLLGSMKSHSEAAKLGLLALDVAQGKKTIEELDSAVDSYKVVQTVKEEEKEDFVNDDIELLLAETYGEGGLNWRLGSLNRSLGPLRLGDMGFVFARPETGKTTFLCSEATYMAEQLEREDRPKEEVILWLNNEEKGSKVVLRCYVASLGASLDKILANKQGARDAYNRKTGGRIKLKDDANISKREVERLCKKYKPRLIIFDQIDKIKGFKADRDDLVLGEIYGWARELAKMYAPVIGVCQAGGEGEGIKYLNMGHVANAKTSKQAEADWILGIGVDFNDPDYVRGLSISKNKLLGSKDTDQTLRHGRWEVMLKGDIARYEDLAH